MNIAYSRYIGVVFAGFCAIMLTGQSPAYSPREDISEASSSSYSFAEAPLRQSNSSEQFSLKDWLSDNGSGGFPENFSDEDRRLQEWDMIPADTH
jgi:hypothetical protein